MIGFLRVSAVTAMIAVTAPALAAKPIGPVAIEPSIGVPAVTMTLPNTGVPFVSSVHDQDGVRFDVPPTLLRRDGMLINGLPPESMQFE